jgi:5-formyltetrahydrofolate cyclo-ligase
MEDSHVPVDVPVAKRALRAEMRRLRRTVTADAADRLVRSARIWSNVVALAGLPDRQRVMLFDGLATEPATDAWFEWCAEHGLVGLRPEVDGPELRVQPGDVDPGALDVVVVPGLAFTPDGRRLGQGGGHYDRFLARLRSDCLTIGACFAEQLVADLPTEPHDLRVHAVATDDLGGIGLDV